MFVMKKQEGYTTLRKFTEVKGVQREPMVRKLKEELSKQNFFQRMLEVFEPSIDRHKKEAEELTESCRKKPFFQKLTNRL